MPATVKSAQYNQRLNNSDASEAELEADYSDDGPGEITPDLEEILSGKLDVGGDFYFAKPYGTSPAPNPFLQLDRFGTIRQPLNANEAKRIIRRFVHAPFGQGERTIVDTSVREMDANKANHRRVDHPKDDTVSPSTQVLPSQSSTRYGRDAHRLAILQAVAERFGIRVSLAIVGCHIVGQAEDYSYSDGWETTRPSGLPIGHVDTREMKVTMVSDLDGTLLLDELELDEDGDEESYQSIPDDQRNIVERGRPDAEEYEGYQGNVSVYVQIRDA
ncbi:hypothetical protein FS837_001687, partial [Tulasnella sp. UAMH 9824]